MAISSPVPGQAKTWPGHSVGFVQLLTAENRGNGWDVDWDG
ncbi:MAG: hypothetical protein VX699_03680 [Myxococcota bacterium]|nr:hypothetical protein [Myxococcota bacterium]